MIIIQGSHRKTGNTARIVELLDEEMRESQIIDLVDHQLAHFDYQGSANDDFEQLIKQVVQHQDIVFATPIYWYTMSGRMKVFLDRISDLLKWNKDLGRQLKGRKIHVISVSGHDDAPEHFTYPFQMTADYLGMTFGQYFHAWGEEGELSTKSLERLKAFSKHF